jgi:hypothetical protein
MLTGEEVAIKLEPAATKFPQLYYEAKLYKIFDGAGKQRDLHFQPIMCSGTAETLLLLTGRRLQCHGDRPPGAVLRGLIRILQAEILSQDSAYAGYSDGKPDQFFMWRAFLASKD